MISSMRVVGTALSPGMTGRTVRAVAHRVFSEEADLVLARDLRTPHQAPRPELDITIRRITARDTEPSILQPTGGLPPTERWGLERRRSLFAQQFGTCYVAVDDRGDACYVAWLFSQHDNPHVHRFFKGWFPPLDASTALLEAVYTVPTHRGKHVMSAASALIAQRAAEFGAHRVLAFVDTRNTASVRGFRHAGFAVCGRRRIRYRLFRRSIVDTGLLPGDDAA